MKTIGNVLWVIFGGGLQAIGWLFVGVIWCITIVGIPVGVQCFKFAGFIFWPFGKTIDYTDNAGKTIINIIWVVLFGWELALSALIIGVIWCLTIVGIPFGLQSIKFAKLALMPLGAEVK